MDLFVVNRYLENTGPEQQDTSEKALRRLHRLAKKRRRKDQCEKAEQTEELDVTSSLQIESDRLQTQKKSHKRKHKLKKEEFGTETLLGAGDPSFSKKRRKDKAGVDGLCPEPDRVKGDHGPTGIEVTDVVIRADENDVHLHETTKKRHLKNPENIEVNCAADDDESGLPKKKRKQKLKEGKDAVAQSEVSPKRDSVTNRNGSGVLRKNRKNRSRKKRVPQTMNNPPASAVKQMEEDCATIGGYTVIGKVEENRRQKVKRMLPDWLTKPTVVSIDLSGDLTPVDGVPGLGDHLVERLRQAGVTHFFPIQSTVIPWLLKSDTRNWIRQPDLCVSSPTGSGKTLAFVLPIVQALTARVVCSIKALVVLPVRDLAVQVFKVFETFCAGTRLRAGLAVGERNMSNEREWLLKDGNSRVDILVCTPGRLVAHISQTPGFSLRDLRFLVIDEADRMMQIIKQDWLNEVEKFVLNSSGETGNSVLTVDRMANLRRMPQKLLFSATLSQDPEKLQEVRLFQPKLFTTIISAEDYKRFEENAKNNASGEFLGKYTTPMELSEAYVECENFLKPLIVLHFIHNLGYRHLLCFTNSVESSHRLSLLLSMYGGVTVREYSSNMSLNVREEIMTNFQKGYVDVIVCSDAFARGMDVKDIDYLISYDLPPYLKTYIHRVGRTARAGRKGTAITLVEKKEVSLFGKMMVNRNVTIEPMIIDTKLLEPMEERYKSALERVKDTLLKETFKSVK